MRGVGKAHTLANSTVTEDFQSLKTAVPRNGPISQPTAPTVASDPPSTNTGSMPVICAPMFSISYSAMIGAATTIEPKPENTDAPRLMKRRVRRSLRNSSQVKAGCSIGGLGDVEGGPAEVVEAWRAKGRIEVEGADWLEFDATRDRCTVL